VMVTDKGTNEKYALKIMTANSKTNQIFFEKERNILKVLDHPNILKFVDCYRDPSSFYIITQLLEGGELFDRIVDPNYPITEKRASEYVRTMLLAINHCHLRNIIHRDIKPENFVFRTTEPESEMVLIDFGYAMIVEREKEYFDFVGTPYYLAPESAIGNKYRRTGEILMSSDLWAIGVITYVLMTGRLPFNGRSNAEIFSNIIKQPLRFPSKVQLSAPLQNFCIQILKKSPKRRMTLQAALEDPWVTGTQSSDNAISKDVLRVLRQFNQQSKLKKAITKVLALNMGEVPRMQLEKHFNRLDKDKNGKLYKEELTILLMDMGYTEVRAVEETEAMIKSTDEDKSGCIEFDEFAAIWQRKLLTTNETYIHQVFSVLDADGNGQIDATELATALDMTSEGDDVKINEIIKEVDVDNDGKINFSEFRAAMVERNDFTWKGADVGLKFEQEEILKNENDDIDIDEVE